MDDCGDDPQRKQQAKGGMAARRVRRVSCLYGHNSVQKFLGFVGETSLLLVVSRTTYFDVVFVPRVLGLVLCSVPATPI